MSYPIALQPLVIEDDQNTKEAYQEIFSSIAEESSAPNAPIGPSEVLASGGRGGRSAAGTATFYSPDVCCATEKRQTLACSARACA